jgi:hypothetical protein
MKNDYWIQKIDIGEYSVLIDHEKKEIIFPENIDDKDLEHIACYLHAEGFLEPVSK